MNHEPAIAEFAPTIIVFGTFFLLVFFAIIAIIFLENQNYKTNERRPKRNIRRMPVLPLDECAISLKENEENREFNMPIFASNGNYLCPTCIIWAPRQIVVISQYGIFEMQVTHVRMNHATAKIKNALPGLGMIAKLEKIQNYFPPKLAKILGVKRDAWVCVSVKAEKKIRTQFNKQQFLKFLDNTVFGRYDLLQHGFLYDLFFDGFENFDKIHFKKLESTSSG